MSPALAQTLVLFILLATGFAAARLRILEEAAGKGISRLLVNLVLPALIVESMQRPFSAALRDEAYAVLGLSFVSYAAAFALAWPLVLLIRAKGASRGAYAFAAVFSNCAFMGFPVVEALLGREYLFAASIANVPFQLLAFSVGAYILARSAGMGARLGLSSLVTPAAVASVLGFALFAGGVILPAPVRGALRLLGDCTTPLSMVLIGSIVSRMDARRAVGDWRLYAVSAWRLVVFPLGLWATLGALGTGDRHRNLLALLAAMPVAANSAILAEAFGGDAETAGSLVLVSTIASLATIPVAAALLAG